MKKLLAAVISLCLALSLCTVPAMAAANLSETLIEECLTTEVSTAITTNFALPETWNEAPITWESSDPSVIEVSEGVAIVKRGIDDVSVTLTATDANDPSDTKVLNFTVLSVLKKVWYNNNFYNPELYSEDDDGMSFGYRKYVPVGTKPVTIPVGNNPYEFIENTGAGDEQPGFFRFGDTNKTTELIKVVPHPIDTKDYSILLESTEGTGQYSFALPGEASELPSGEVQVSLRLAVASEYQKKWGFGFNGKLEGYNRHVIWRYNNNVDGATTYTTWNEVFNEENNPGRTSPGTQAYQNAPIENMVTTGDYLDASVTFNVKTENTALECIQTSTGTIKALCNPYIHSQKIEGKDGIDADKVFKTISFTTTSTSQMYVDDIVITTNTTELPGDTAAERIAVYKRMLTTELDRTIADKTCVTEDISLDFLSDFTDYTVTWESSNENAIIIDEDSKKADVQLVEIIKDVTLTCTIEHDGATDTIILPLTVKPYGSSTVSYLATYDAEASAITKTYTGKITFDHLAVGDYAANEADNALLKTAFTVAEENGNKYATMRGNYLRYGYGSSLGRVGGTYKTISFNAKIDKPQVEEISTLRTAITITTQGNNTLGKSTYTPVQIYMPYVIDENGNVTKSYWYVSDGSNNVSTFRYTDDATTDSLPDLDKWFNVQIVMNTTSYTFDLYIDGVKIYDAAIYYAEGGDGTKNTQNLYSITFDNQALKGDIADVTVSWDDLEILSNDAEVELMSADIMSASIKGFGDTLTSVGANGTAIEWEIEGDATINGTSLAKTKDRGYGETTVTATATTSFGTMTREYNLFYGSVIRDVNIENNVLKNIKYSSDVEANGYIAFYNSEKALMGTSYFKIKNGRNTATPGIDIAEIPVPEGYSTVKIFAWDEDNKPITAELQK